MPPTTASTRAPLIDIGAVAERLGVSARHVRRLVHERRIPFLKWGHLLRFSPAAIDTWVNQCTYSPGHPAVPLPPRRRPAQAEPPRDH